MSRRYDIKAIFGKDFEFELTPDVLAHEVSMDFSTQIIIDCFKKGMTLYDLEDKLGLSAECLSEKLNGENLTLEEMAAIAIACNKDIEIKVVDNDSNMS